MHHLVDTLHGAGDVVGGGDGPLQEAQLEAFEVAARARHEVVEHDHLTPLGAQAGADVGPDEPSAARDQDAVAILGLAHGSRFSAFSCRYQAQNFFTPSASGVDAW